MFPNYVHKIKRTMSNVIVITVESSVRGSHHLLPIGLVDVSIVRPGGLRVRIPHHFSCAVVLCKKLLCLKLICFLIWVNKEMDISETL